MWIVHGVYLVFVAYFLQQTEENGDFESFTPEELDQALAKFYQTAVIEPHKLRHFPAEISRHLSSEAIFRNISIETDPIFETSNSVLSQMYVDTSMEDLNVGPEDNRRKKPMTQEHLNKLYDSGVLSNDNPTSLQNKVWVELMIYVGGLARQDLRNLEKDHFMFEKDDAGKLYFRLDAHWMTETKKQIRVYEQPDNLNCPVRSLWLYLSKLNPKSPVFFQQPFKEPTGADDTVWYSFRPIGKNAHSTWLATICKEAGVTTEYRNQALYCRAAPFKSESKEALKTPKK